MRHLWLQSPGRFSLIRKQKCRSFEISGSGQVVRPFFNCYTIAYMTPPTLTTSNGQPVPRNGLTASVTAGPRGPILLEDFALLDTLAHFDRERVPERVVHAKGAGAFGYFEVTSDAIRKYCKANMFSKVGKRTPIAVRFSQVALESGSPDTVRDVRGFAVKFYSEEGNWDLVGNNTPVFFIRDPILFPSFIHALKRNPQTHLRDNNLFWDFLSLRPESLHQQTILFSDRGIPDGYRFMNGYGSNTFKNVNENGEVVFVKYHYKSDQGIRNLSDEQAQKLSGLDADYALRDLFESIASENYPVWTMYLQVMTPEQAQHCSFNPFDVTKIWPHNEFPLIEIGRFVLNRNPQNYFAEVEQLVFSPAHFIPGIGPSPDKVLQGRLFSYNDAHYHRLGVNYSQIPVNRTVINSQTYHRDGLMRVDGNMFNEPAHFPNSLGGPEESKVEKFQSYSGDFSVIDKYETRDDDNFTQTRLFYQKVLDDSGRERLAGNIAGSLVNASKEVQTRVLANFEKVDPDYAKRVDKQLQVLEQENAKGMIKEKQPTAPMNPPRAPFKVTMEMSDDVLAPQFRRQCAV